VYRLHSPGGGMVLVTMARGEARLCVVTHRPEYSTVLTRSDNVSEEREWIDCRDSVHFYRDGFHVPAVLSHLHMRRLLNYRLCHDVAVYLKLYMCMRERHIYFILLYFSFIS
jgi:hypothetical protein